MKGGWEEERRQMAGGYFLGMNGGDGVMGEEKSSAKRWRGRRVSTAAMGSSPFGLWDSNEEEEEEEGRKEADVGMGRRGGGADIVILQETWVEKKDEGKAAQKMSANFNWKFKSAFKEYAAKKGRARGGQAVGIRKGWEGCWDVREWEYGFILGSKLLRDSTVIIAVYNNVGIGKIGKELREVILREAGKKEDIVIVGDFNARIGSELAVSADDLEARGYDARRSQDTVLNAEGKRLLSLCEDLGLKVLNGRIEGDREGKVTFVGGGEECRGSVIDYVLVVDRGGEEVRKLEVIDRIESDHLPLRLTMGGAEVMVESGEEEGDEECELVKLSWKEECGDQFCEEVQRDLDMIEGGEGWEAVKGKILGAAEKVGLVRSVGRSKRKRRLPRWFDEECRRRREEVWKKLKVFTKCRSKEAKAELVAERKEMRRVIKKAKEKWRSDIWEQVGKAKGMPKWWEAINKFRDRGRLGVGERISGREWKEHFEMLLNGERGGGGGKGV
ncbi:hypothetical protein M0802_015053 [Mischocyttarus mexicanus]|nr:hypothetical protein M0802_015053 [Mischocyttarus mexicanus]